MEHNGTGTAITKRVTRSAESELAICEALASGTPIEDFDKDPLLPSAKTYYRWLKDDEDGTFTAEVAIAKMVRASRFAAKGLGALEDVNLKKLDPKIANAAVNLAAKRADYYKWLAGVTDRATWGQKLELEVSAVDKCGRLGANLVQGAAVVIAKALPERTGDDEGGD